MPSPTSTRTLPPPPSTGTAFYSRPRPRPRYKKTELPPTPQEIDTALSPTLLSLNHSEDSDLTPLSSPAESRAPNISPVRKHASVILSSSALVTETPRKRRSQVDQDTWDIESLGPYVWVLIDRRARIFDPEDLDDMQSHPERLWWPGKIQAASFRKKPLKVRLFGTAAPGVKTIEIHNPCESNIVALESPQHRMSLDEPTFVNLASRDENILASPRKKHKVDRNDIKERWCAAKEELAQDKVEEGGSDVMPEVGTVDFQLFVSSTPTKSTKEATPRQHGKVKGKGNGKRKRRNSDSESDADSYRVSVEDEGDVGRKAAQARWSPPPPDSLLTIPGEGVLAAVSATCATYWPAQILRYVPPKNAKQEPKYQVRYLDLIEKIIPRKWFYTIGENGFITCKLGTWKSVVNEVQNDEDEDDDTRHINDSRSRSMSPIPIDPPPEADAFVELNVRAQFAYVKPVLMAILNDEYPHARTRHNKFIIGGSWRQSVVEDAALRGQMDPRDVAHLQECLVRWCLREERKAKTIIDEDIEGRCSLARSADDETEMAKAISAADPAPSRRLVSPAGSNMTAALSPSDVPPESSFTTELQESELPSTSLSRASGSSSASSSNSGNARSPNDRQRGCDAYEGLSVVEKLDYCLNVLLPEAVLQVLLWRGGHRRSVELLSEAEEAGLHQKGKDLLQESDWVNDIMRFRDQLAKSKARKSQAGKSAGGETLFSVTGRPRRGVGAPKSYQE